MRRALTAKAASMRPLRAVRPSRCDASAPPTVHAARAGRSARALAATAAALLMTVLTVALYGPAGFDMPVALTAGALIARVVYVPLTITIDAVRARRTQPFDNPPASGDAAGGAAKRDARRPRAA
jgi:hypothetical protein